jgi:hypothetical protein
MLKDIIDWEKVMVQPRYAGGHVEIMENLFKNATVIAKHVEQNYEGELGYIYKLEDKRFVITNDYFGSCSGCDAYEDCTDEELKNLCVQLANNSKTFDSVVAMITFLRSVKEDQAVNYDLRNLATPLISELYKNRIVKIDEILSV